MSSFDTFPLRIELKKALVRLKYTAPTPIQASSLPAILEHRNVIAQAATGSGKTLAFSLGLLNRIDPASFYPQSLVLCPTRELAEQVAKVIRSLASEIGNVKVLTLCGGVPMRGHIHSLSHGAHIIVGTPGRILRLLKMEKLNLSRCHCAVLDEADHMVDIGFIDDIDAIFSFLPSNRQTLLFSATFPDSIRSLTDRLIDSPLLIQTDSIQTQPVIDQFAYRCHDKTSALLSAIALHSIQSGIVFCNTKAMASELCDTLNRYDLHALPLHGDMEQFERTETMVQFRNKSVSFLIATDIAGRGIDIEGLESVVNYDVPLNRDRFVHRIGRTGRMGQKGIAITLIDSEQNEDYQRLENPIEPVPIAETPYTPVYHTPMRTICIDAGKKEKLRAGDIVGALIHECSLQSSEIGTIDILDHLSYVALSRNTAEMIYKKLINRPIKGKIFRLWLLD